MLHKEANGEWLFVYTALVWLYQKDIGRNFFGEDWRTGYTQATLCGDGKIQFQEEIVLDEDEHIFTEPPFDYPFPNRSNIPRQHVPGPGGYSHLPKVVLEMTKQKRTTPNMTDTTDTTPTPTDTAKNQPPPAPVPWTAPAVPPNQATTAP